MKTRDFTKQAWLVTFRREHTPQRIRRYIVRRWFHFAGLESVAIVQQEAARTFLITFTWVAPICPSPLPQHAPRRPD